MEGTGTVARSSTLVRYAVLRYTAVDSLRNFHHRIRYHHRSSFVAGRREGFSRAIDRQQTGMVPRGTPTVGYGIIHLYGTVEQRTTCSHPTPRVLVIHWHTFCSWVVPRRMRQQHDDNGLDAQSVYGLPVIFHFTVRFSSSSQCTRYWH